jgi:hypothetical protein
MDLLLDGARVSAISPYPFIDASVQVGLCGHFGLPAPGHLAIVYDLEIVPPLWGVFVADDEGHYVQLDVEVWFGARIWHSLGMYLDFWGQGSLGLDDGHEHCWVDIRLRFVGRDAYLVG